MKNPKFMTRLCGHCKKNIGKIWSQSTCPHCQASLAKWRVIIDYEVKCPECKSTITCEEMSCSECGFQVQPPTINMWWN